MQHQYLKAATLAYAVLFSTTYAADAEPGAVCTYKEQAQYPVRAYEDQYDHDFIFDMITSHPPSFVKKEIKEFHETLHNMLKDNSLQKDLFWDIRKWVLHRNEEDIECAGIVAYYINKEDKNCCIDMAYVKPEYASDSSLHRVMLNKILNYCRNEKADFVKISVHKIHTTEINTLKKLGFSETAHNKNFPDEVLLKLRVLSDQTLLAPHLTSDQTLLKSRVTAEPPLFESDCNIL